MERKEDSSYYAEFVTGNLCCIFTRKKLSTNCWSNTTRLQFAYFLNAHQEEHLVHPEDLVFYSWLLSKHIPNFHMTMLK